MQWTPDWGLRARMVLTMLLVGVLYVAFLGVLTFADVGIAGIVVFFGLFGLAVFR